MTLPHELKLTRAARELALGSALAEIGPALDARDVRPLLLRGPVFARWLYADPSERSSRDIDLLVAPDLLGAAREVLVERGFEPIGTGTHPHERADHHELWLRRAPVPVLVELHRTIRLVAAPDTLVWERFSEGKEAIEVAGARIDSPRPAVCALMSGLHAAQHGAGAYQPMEDIRRAVAQVPHGTWLEAAALARELGAAGALAVGLGLAPGGQELAEAIGLGPEAAAREVRLRALTPPRTAMGIEQLAAARGAPARLLLLARKVAPSPESMRFHYPRAGDGRLGLGAAYVNRAVVLARELPAGVRAWHSAGPSPRTPAERRLLVDASVALAVMRLSTALFPFRVICRILGLREGRGPDALEPAAEERAILVGWAVRAAAGRMPWHCSCFTQALAVVALLRRSGAEATMYLGVGKDEGAAGVAAHAWVCCGSLGLTGTEEAGSYTPIATFRAR